jgi:Pyruvate/2-oxoacid:ferredoxin oxidoreductase delta subunit
MAATTNARRVIQVNKDVIGPSNPRRKTVRIKKATDYPGVPAAYLSLAKKLSNPLLFGPPICDELMAFLQHAFTEEEAEFARRLSAASGRSAEDVARAAGRPADEVAPILHRLAFEKRTIGCDGTDETRRYRLMPVMPGMFELVLIGESPDSMTEWHRRFAELFEALFETGYILDYQDRRASLIRFLPLGGVAGAHPMALPSDKLEVVLDRYDVFGVGHCQCRMVADTVGQPCDKPLEVCTVMGPWTKLGIEAGWLRQVSKKNILEIKREAESHGLVTWVMNVESTGGQVSCSCCGCCCKAMRIVSEFNAPGLAAPPHFMPRFDNATCTHCGRCARACPMGAITVDTSQKTLNHQPARCIGCGLCMLACEKQQAISIEPVPDYRLPYKSWFSLLMRTAPGMLRTSWKVWRSREG